MSPGTRESRPSGFETSDTVGVETQVEDWGDHQVDGLSRGEIFDMLSNERRRYALDYLKRHDDTVVELRELVDHIAARENDVREDALHYEQRKRVYSALRQTHLPRLAKRGLIEYDEDRGQVKLNGAARELQMHMEYVPEHDIAWCYHYLGLALVLGAMAVLTYAGVFPFSGLPWSILVTIAILAVGVSAAVHAIYTNRHKLGSDWIVDDRP